MAKKEKIPVHRMDDWFAGTYIKPFGAELTGKAYERAEPHRHDFYYIVLVEQGELELEVDSEAVRLGDQTLFLFSRPAFDLLFSSQSLITRTEVFAPDQSYRKAALGIS